MQYTNIMIPYSMRYICNNKLNHHVNNIVESNNFLYDTLY